MQGLYVDDADRLVLVVATGEKEWMVHGVNNDHEGWVGTMIQAPDGTLTLRVSYDDAATQGSYDTRKILWGEEAGAWTRLEASFEQVHILTRRPYIPITYVLYVTVRECVVGIAGYVATQWKSRKHVH